MAGFKVVDCHAHINSEFFKEDCFKILENSLLAGVVVINIGTNEKDSEENIKIAKKFENGVWAAVGIHPTEKAELTERGELKNYDFLKKMAEDEKVVAIGECGLDYFRVKDDELKIKEIERQKNLFKEQIKIAKEVGKPLMLHLRTDEAYRDALDILKEEKDLPKIIFHFYTGGKKFLEEAIVFDSFFTFGGTITFLPKKNEKNEFQEVAEILPMERILFETDSPFVTPEPNRGGKNEPRNVILIAEKIAEIKGEELEEILKMEKSNAERVFKIKL